MKQTTAPDWASMIEDLLAAKMTQKAIGEAMGSILTDRMLRHYRIGAEPLYHRGRALVELWTKTTGLTEVPTIPFIRGHRAVKREADQSPRVQSMPAWPASPQPAVKPLKRKYTKRAAA